MTNWQQIEEEWRRRWEDAKVFEADVDSKKPKFFLTVAYPYPNSPQHIGHGRTYTLADVHARYRRMKGYNVLFPMAFHYTGTPILAMAKRLADGDEEIIDAFTRIYHVPEDAIRDFKEPLMIAQYFHKEIREGMREMGYSIDWRREFTTIDRHYSRFIEWQFHKLHEKGFIVQGSHPVGWCPNDGNPVGQHDTVGDVEPEVGEFTIIKFLIDGDILPAATLRPETVFGVTNIWLRPDATYLRADVDGEVWVVSKKSISKLRHQGYKVKELDEVRGAELVGRWAVNPATGSKVPILPASFVDPATTLGVVMSVPGHAPYDYQALEDLKKRPEELRMYRVEEGIIQSLSPISIIEVEGYSEFPALDAIKRLGIKSQDDPKLEEATEEVYMKEFHMGRMKANTMDYSGLTVRDGRDRVKEDFLATRKGAVLYEILNRPVICRCGTECVVKIFENQWFINYGDVGWKELAQECLDGMEITPEEMRPEFNHTISWLKQKACARKSGLGTRLPWDKEWIIESLSDSVIYMVYYVLSKYINKHGISSDQLTDKVLDYVLLGIGSVEEAARASGMDVGLLRTMKEELFYFYPLDSRHSGRDLVPNHLTFFIFNHAAIFPRELWPRQIVVNGSVLMEGKKMSKSLGNIIPLREGIRAYGTDALRLAILSTSELLQDADFSPTLAKGLSHRLERLHSFASDVIKLQAKAGTVEASALDRWLLSRLQRTVKNTTEALDKLRVREALNYALYELDQDIQWYLRRSQGREGAGGISPMGEVLDVRVRLLAPFTPYLCEEIWKAMGREGFISVAEWPRYDEEKVDEGAEEVERMVKSTLEDTLNIIRVTRIEPKRVCYYVSAGWKWSAYLMALKVANAGVSNVGQLIGAVLAQACMEGVGEEVQKFVQRACEEVLKMSPEVRQRRARIRELDEMDVLMEAQVFLEKELNAQVDVYREGDASCYDPKNRARLAQPYRPAIYIEGAVS